MRTTLSIEDDAFHKAQTYAQLTFRDTANLLPMKQKDRVWIIDLPGDLPRVTARQVKDLMDDPS